MLNKTSVTRICAAIVLLYGVLLCMTSGQSQGWPGSGRTVDQSTTYIDYVPIWTGGRLVLEGRPLSAYDWAAHRKASHELLGRKRQYYQPWPYPPIFFAMIAPFALLPYGTSMLLWVSLTLAAYSATAARIVGDRRGALWMAASVPALYNAMVGQNGALSAAILGMGLLLVPSRPVMAGVCIGLLSYKPHLGLLLPLALGAAGYWRTFAAAAATTVALVLATTMVFGAESWTSFIAQIPKVGEQFFSQHTALLQSPYGALMTAGASKKVAYTMQIALALSTAVVITWLWWRKDVDFDTKAAALAAASLLMSPYLFVYDMCLLMVAQAFLIRAHVAGRYDEIEIAGIVLANALVLLAPIVYFPTGVFASLILLALALRRVPGLQWSPYTGSANIYATQCL